MNNRLKKFLITILAVLTATSFSVFAISCNKENDDEKTNVTFSLNYHLKSISLYETLQLEVEGFENLTWSSDNQSVVSVVNGLVTANAYGTANITAKSGNYTDTCIINVLNEGKVPSVKINVDDNGFNLLKGDTYQLECGVRFNNQDFADGTFSFVSSNTDVVSVSADGLVTAKNYGDAIITVTGSWRDFDSMYLIKDIAVSVTPDLSMELSIAQNEIFTMAGEIEGVNYSNKTILTHQVILNGQNVTETANIQWVVSDTDIVSVDENSNVTAKNRGSAEIYYEYAVDGKTYSSLPVKVTVNAPKKTISDLFVYEIGTESFIPNSLFEGNPYSLKIKSADYSQKTDFAGEGIFIESATQNGFKGKEISFTVDTSLYSYSINVLFVTHAISTADEFIDFLNSYSGSKSNVESNMSNTYYAVLTNNIDLNGKSIPKKAYNGDRFFGVFNGLGHAILNAKVNSTGGIFGGLHNCTLENFALIDATVTDTYSSYAVLAGYLYPSSKIRNIYAKASVNLKTFYRGLFYSNTNGIVSNIITDFTYGPVNESTNKFVYGVSDKSTGMMNNPSQIYAIGNATAYSGRGNSQTSSDASANYDVEIQGTVYSDIGEFFKDKKSQITLENGFSKYWQVTDGALSFGDKMLYMDPEYLEDVSYVQTWTYDKENVTVYSERDKNGTIERVHSNWKIKETVTIDFASILGKTPVSVRQDEFKYAVEDGKITLNPANYTNGNTYVFTVQCADKVYYQPIAFVSQYIESISEFKDFLKLNASVTGYATSTISSLITGSWYAVLAKDLDFASMADKSITEIGHGTRFYGTIDGQGHSISNLELDQALFGYNFGTIKNIAFINVNTSDYGSNKGLSYGAFASQTGAITNVYMSISTSKVGAYKGVIDVLHGVKVSNCIFDVNYSEDNTASVTYAINGAATSASKNIENTYFMGNADQIQPEDTNKPFADGTFAKAVKDGTVVINSANGFSDSWRVVTEGTTTTIYFANNVVDKYVANN